MALTTAEALKVHASLHDKSKSNVEINGTVFPIENVSVKAKGSAKGSPPVTYRKVTVFGVQFMEQNPTKPSKYADLARQGSKITWIPWGKAWGLIRDGVVEKRCQALDDKIIRASPVPPQIPPSAAPVISSLKAEPIVSPTIPSSRSTAIRSEGSEGSAKKKQKTENGSLQTAIAEDTVLSEWIIKFEDIDLGEKIGAGAFGEVRKGKFGDMDVAVKVLFGQDSKAKEMFIKEAKLLASLAHDNIVPCIGFTLEPTSLVMEYMPENLSQFLKDHHPLGDALLKKFAIGVARGLEYLHSRQIIHRDIKPANILLDSSLNARIADFGVSREAAANMTMTKIGTPTYCAPEVLNGDKYSLAVDVYSYGILLCALFTGGNPWKSSENLSPAQIIMRVVVKKERPMLPPSVSVPFKDLIQRCWQDNPLLRPSSAQIVSEIDSMRATTSREVLTSEHTASTLVFEKPDENKMDLEAPPNAEKSGEIYGSSLESGSFTDGTQLVGGKSRCKYDETCFRKNALHFAQYSHPVREAKLAYRAALAAVLRGGEVSRSQKKELLALRELNQVKEKDHEKMLDELGWSLDEYDAGAKTPRGPSKKRKKETDAD